MTFNPIDHPICFEKPKYISGHSAWVEHIPFAFAIISLLRPKIFVELGSHYGDSYCAFCQAVEELKLPTACYAVDTWQGDEHSRTYGPEVLQTLRQHHDAEYGGFSNLIQSTFDDATRHFQDGSIDLLHIDGLHTYDAVKHDFEIWLPKMSRAGVVLIHDTNVRERDFGVWRLWSELKDQYPNHEFLHGHGLGVIAVGDQISAQLKGLLETKGEGNLVISRLFSKLGASISQEVWRNSQINSLNQAVAERDGQVANRNQAVAERDGQIVALNQAAANLIQTIFAREAQITNLNQAVAEREGQINGLSQTVHEREGQIAGLNQAVGERDAQFANLNQAAAEREGQINGLSQSVHERDGQITNLNQAVDERDAQINSLSQTAHERDGEIATLAATRVEILSSTSWQITKPLRFIAHQVKRIRHVWRLSPSLIQRGGGVSSTAIKAIKVLHNEGLAGVKQRIVHVQRHPSNNFENTMTEEVTLVVEDDCAVWIRENDTLTEEARATLRDQISGFERKPLISLLMTASNTNTEWLQEAIDSIRKQIYPNWELCIAAESSSETTRLILESYVQEDTRIKVAFIDQLGQDGQPDNEALKLVTGEYGALIGPDILLAERALFWLAEHININPETVIICSNEDEIGENPPELAPLLNYFGVSDEFKEGSNSQMIDRINKVLCYWRNHGTGRLYRLILLKLASRIQQNESKEQDECHGKSEGISVHNLINSRFAALTPLRIYSFPSSQKRRINIVTDSVGSSSLFGGVGTALIFSALLANKLGAQLRIVTRTERAHPANVDHILSLYGIKLDNEIQFKFAAFNDQKYELDVAKDDLFITTSWWTTAATLPSVPHSSIIYLLQEDERMFYPFGDDRFQCESILSNRDIRFLINTKLLFDHLVESGLDNIAAQGKWFEPAFSAQVFYPRKKAQGGKRKFFFYARPNNSRNLFYLGVEVIEQAIMQQVLDLDQWEICLVGKDIPNVTFGNGYVPTKIESLPWSAYAEFAGTVDVGLSLMYTPHPSYPPLDMAASGAVVVTNRFANKRDLSGYSANLICAEMDKDSLVEAIRKAVVIATDSNLREQNYRNNKLLTDWHSSFTNIIEELSGVI